MATTLKTRVCIHSQRFSVSYACSIRMNGACHMKHYEIEVCGLYLAKGSCNNPAEVVCDKKK